MGTGYTRNDTGNNIADGNVINASDLDGEFDAVQAAFNGSTGHSHDGTTGEGPQIDTAGIADSAVETAKINDGAVTTDKLGADAVTGAKIGDDQIDSEHYVAGSIDREHLAADIIDGTKIADDVINSEHYVAGSIDNEHLADDAVTGAKIDSTTTVTAASFVGPLTGAVTGNADTATALATGRTISLTGDVTGTSGSFDGTGNVSITATIADDSHNHVISNVDGLQTALDGKQATITGAATTIDDTNLTASRAVVSDGSGKVAVSAVTSTELGYLDGVTSAIQTQIDGKQASGSYAVTTNNLSDLSSASTARSNLGLGALATLDTVAAATITDNSVGAAELNVSGNGTTSQFLRSDGDGTFTWAEAGGGGDMIVRYYNSSTTWSKPSGLNAAHVIVIGGGGGGGAAVSNGSYAAGGQGGSAAYSEEYFDAASLSANVSVTVGANGAGVSYNQNGGTGYSGGTSSFGGYLSANGGGGGGYGNGGIGNGGGQGNSSGGDLNITGDDGYRLTDARALPKGMMGRGTVQNTNTQNGANNILGGGGGGAIRTSNGSQSGGNGGYGIVIVKEFY